MLDMHEVIGSSPIIPTMRLVLCERVFLINIIYYVAFQIICEVLRRRNRKSAIFILRSQRSLMLHQIPTGKAKRYSNIYIFIYIYIFIFIYRAV